VFGNLDDHLLPATGLPPMLGQFLDVFVIPVRSHAPSKKLLAALEAAGYPHRTVDVDGCGPVSFFDLSGR
jgi:hypothetical protein